MEQNIIYAENGYSIETFTANDHADQKLVVVFQGACARLARQLAWRLCEQQGLRTAFVAAPEEGWFQDVGVMAAVAQLAAPARHVTVIGSDMGAYGALRLATITPVDHVIALSPVATIDPRRGPQDWRFDEAFDIHGGCVELRNHMAGRYSVIYDPGSIEKRHLAHLNIPTARLVTVPVPGTCGFVAQIMYEASLLDETLAVMHTAPDGAALAQSIRAARPQSGTYMRALAERNLQLRPGVTLWAANRLGGLSARPRVVRRLIQRVGDVAPEMVA